MASYYHLDTPPLSTSPLEELNGSPESFRNDPQMCLDYNDFMGFNPTMNDLEGFSMDSMNNTMNMNMNDDYIMDNSPQASIGSNSISSVSGEQEPVPPAMVSPIEVPVHSSPKQGRKSPKNGAKKQSKPKAKIMKVVSTEAFLSPDLPSEEKLRLMSNEEFQKYWSKLREYPAQDQDRLRLIKRRIKNRESASASRQRKRDYCEELEKKNAELQEQNDALLKELEQVKYERDLYRCHAEELYQNAKKKLLDFDNEVEQRHSNLGFATQMIKDNEGFLIDVDEQTPQSYTEDYNSELTTVDGGHSFNGAKFAILTVFALIAIVFCMSAIDKTSNEISTPLLDFVQDNSKGSALAPVSKGEIVLLSEPKSRRIVVEEEIEDDVIKSHNLLDNDHAIDEENNSTICSLPDKSNFECRISEEALRKSLSNSDKFPYLVAQKYTILGSQFDNSQISNNSTIGIILPETQNSFVELLVKVIDGKKTTI